MKDGKPTSQVGPTRIPANKAATGRDDIPFPEKLMDVLMSEAAPDAVWWLPEGESFAINFRPNKHETLCRVFDVRKVKSISRRLVRWGFSSVTDTALVSGAEAYYHSLFRKCTPHLAKSLRIVKRFSHKKSKKSRSRKEKQQKKDEPGTCSVPKKRQSLVGTQVHFLTQNDEGEPSRRQMNETTTSAYSQTLPTKEKGVERLIRLRNMLRTLKHKQARLRVLMREQEEEEKTQMSLLNTVSHLPVARTRELDIIVQAADRNRNAQEALRSPDKAERALRTIDGFLVNNTGPSDAVPSTPAVSAPSSVNTQTTLLLQALAQQIINAAAPQPPSRPETTNGADLVVKVLALLGNHTNNTGV